MNRLRVQISPRLVRMRTHTQTEHICPESDLRKRFAMEDLWHQLDPPLKDIYVYMKEENEI